MTDQHYKFVYTRQAVEDIAKLDIVVKKRIKKALERFGENPLYFAKRLLNSQLGNYRFRIGDYRLPFDLDGQEITILRVGHRREIYRTK